MRRAWPACVMRSPQVSAGHKRTGPLRQRLKTRRNRGPSAPRCKQTGQNPDATRNPRFATPRLVDAGLPKSLRKSACPHPPDDPKMTGGCRTPKKPEKERMCASTNRGNSAHVHRTLCLSPSLLAAFQLSGQKEVGCSFSFSFSAMQPFLG